MYKIELVDDNGTVISTTTTDFDMVMEMVLELYREEEVSGKVILTGDDIQTEELHTFFSVEGACED
jgi:uncharacterized protein YpmS